MFTWNCRGMDREIIECNCIDSWEQDSGKRLKYEIVL